MKILFIAPLPPPINGHSLASKVLLDDLAGDHAVEVVDLSRDSRNDGTVTPQRLLAIARILREVRMKRANSDAVYLTISESLAGNLKDLCIYLLCRPVLSRMYVHLHGGSIRRLLFDRNKTMLRLNAIFYKRLAGVIVSGRSHLDVFRGMIDPARVHIVPNFAQEYMFRDEAAIASKFENFEPLRVLYVSGMSAQKGYLELADGFESLPPEIRRKARLDFAGKFDSEEEKLAFFKKIDGRDGVRYHGVVDDVEKRNLFGDAHVFCLPTAHFEGQPISILEAYASGCVVVTTGQSGIGDIFTAGVNGFEVEPRSTRSIRSVLETMIASPLGLGSIALANRRTAGKAYRTATFNAAVREILETPK
jgi:glycosyltransferase involved in cell wall biosynthesis